MLNNKHIHNDLDGVDHKGTPTPHIQKSNRNENRRTVQVFYNNDRGAAQPMT